ncbi:hypothetical protein KA082_02270, partial [Candidatus Woesebacteria bacterium]|nr:hypothetical protein [Candidatus Woesebacteria bacterium]
MFLSGTNPFVKVAFAQDCEKISCDKGADEDQYISCIQTKKSCLEDKIAQIQTQKTTLTSTIGILNSKILVQELQINQIKAEISKLEREIGGLAERISGLNVSLDRMSSLLVERVREQYKQSRVSPLTLLFAADTFDEFNATIKYLAETSNQTAEGMHKAEIQRVLYDQQKELKEKKQDEVEVKKKQLDVEKAKLNEQIRQQRELLAVTNNDESRYQQLLSEAEAQIASFKKFVTVSGGGVIGPDGLGKGYDGFYYSQRDSRWAGATIGSSRETVFNVGCLITSLAMVLKSKG